MSNTTVVVTGGLFDGGDELYSLKKNPSPASRSTAAIVKKIGQGYPQEARQYQDQEGHRSRSGGWKRRPTDPSRFSVDKSPPACAFPRRNCACLRGTMHAYRSHTCGQLRIDHQGQDTRLSGWVHRVRDHGGVLFIDLRDHYGMTQVVADPDSPAFKQAEKLRSEWVVRVDGKVRPRPAGHREPRSADRPHRSLRHRNRSPSPGRRTAAAGVWRYRIPRRHPPQIPLPRFAPRPHSQQHHEARARSSTRSAGA